MNRLFIATVCALSAFPAYAQSNDPFQPEGHIKIERPADVNAADASALYDQISKQMAEGYGQSDLKFAQNYQKWLKFNSSPYLSAGHGNRFMNNYGNEVSKDYLKLEEGGSMPVGSMLVKDSFTLTEDEEIFAGAVFLMEKLPKDSYPETADWRYVMVLPDGSLIGDTIGENPESMTFCHTCHLQVEDTDYLFGIPGKYADKKFQ